MKKVLLIDDDYEMFVTQVARSLEGVGEIIPTIAVTIFSVGLDIIENNPEADCILLDGYFKCGTNCGDLVPLLDQADIAKIICFSDAPEDWEPVLRRYGVRHFPGKRDDYRSCVEGTCSC